MPDTACANANEHLGVLADVDGDGTHETYVVFKTLLGEAEAFQVERGDYGVKSYFYTGLDSECGGVAPWRPGTCAIWFVDATAPGFDQYNETTWTYKGVPGVRLAFGGDEMPINLGMPNPYRQLKAYTRRFWRGTRVGTFTHEVGDTTPQICEFLSAEGIEEIFMRSDFTENTIASLIILQSAPETARYLRIEFTFPSEATPGLAPMTPDQTRACDEAAALWARYLKDLMTVKVFACFYPFAAGNRQFADTISAKTTHPYSAVRQALRDNADRDYQKRSAMNQLPESYVNVRDFQTINPRAAWEVTMSTANAKALGLGTGRDSYWPSGREIYPDVLATYDAIIIFNQNNEDAGTLDYTRSDGIAAGKHDFVGVVLHELGHALGFWSMTDGLDWFNDGNNLAEYRPLGPNTLDLWRFNGAGGTPPDIGSATRLLTCGAAKYYDSFHSPDSFSWGYPLSWGVKCADPLCRTSDDKCQSSHWQIPSLSSHVGIMDPTLGAGTELAIHTIDVTALGLIGYDESYWNPFLLSAPSLCRWCPPNLSPTNMPLPFAGFPALPLPPTPPFPTNLGTVLGLDLRIPGPLFGQRRSGLGYAYFAPAQTNSYPLIVPWPSDSGLELRRAAMLPPAIRDLYFVSDRTNGVPFSARASDAQYDPNLGTYGGYRLALTIDGEGDGITGDIDGTMVLELLADQHQLPDGQIQNVFTTASNALDNTFHPSDGLALCLCEVGSPGSESEPNGSPVDANDLGQVGFSTVVGSIASVGDRDYYRFTAPTNTKAWITVDTGGMQSSSATTRNSYLRLLASDGTTVIEEDNDDGSGNGCDRTLESGSASAIAGRTLLGGDYYLEVRADGEHDVLSPYRLLVTITAGAIAAESEPNNTAATATPIVTPVAPKGVRSGFLNTNDLDYYAVTVSGPSLLHVSADSDPERHGATHNIIVDLITRDGSTVLFSADSSFANQADAAAEAFGFVVASNGTYYARVREATGQTGSYHLMVAACPITTMPKLQVASLGSNVCTLTWPTAQAYGYQLQSSTDLTLWSDTSCQMTYADGIVQASVPMLAGDLRRFYRIRGIWPPPP